MDDTDKIKELQARVDDLNVRVMYLEASLANVISRMYPPQPVWAPQPNWEYTPYHVWKVPQPTWC